MRAIAMPRLLHTVILFSHEAVLSFLKALKVQQDFPQTTPKLTLNYAKFVRRFWSSEYHLPILGGELLEDIDYRPLHDLLCNVRDVGFNFRSIHLLDEVLELKSSSAVSIIPVSTWKRTRMTFAGSPLWNPLTSTSGGSAFLENITHLAIWGPVKSGSRLQPQPALHGSFNYLLPDWIKSVPFKLLKSLTQFACTLIDIKGTGRVPIAVYSYQSPDLVGTLNQPAQNGGVIIRQWVASKDPLSDDNVRVIHDSGLPVFEGNILSKFLEAAFDRAVNGLWLGELESTVYSEQRSSVE